MGGCRVKFRSVLVWSGIAAFDLGPCEVHWALLPSSCKASCLVSVLETVLSTKEERGGAR